MKSVMLSIQPKYCELIASGKKTVEVRKTRPKIETPFKCYIYCTKAKDKASVDGYTFFDDELYIDHWLKTLTCGHTQFEEIVNGKVIGEFVCSNIAKGTSQFGSCLTMQEIAKYANNKEVYGWCISDLVIYDKPKELSEFTKPYGTIIKAFGSRYIQRPPQSWYYVEEWEE